MFYLFQSFKHFSFTDAAEIKSYHDRAVHYIWLFLLFCTLLWQLSLLLSNLLINTWSLPEQSRTREEIMEEHLASSLTVQKPCQTPFVNISIIGTHQEKPLTIVGSLNTCITEVEEWIIQSLRCLDCIRHCVDGWISHK